MTDDTESSPTPPAPSLPAITSLLLETPLYTVFPFEDDDDTRRKLEALRRGNLSIDAYCLHCKRDSVFKTLRSVGGGSGSGGGSSDPEWMLKNSEWMVDVSCVRNSFHKYRYILLINDRKLLKIGQWPSLEDIAGADIEKYRNQLKGGYFRELKTATGLASHGIGIGSFVYLRRIFERLIYQHHEELPKPVEGFGTMRMDEKINALKSVLPSALVTHRAAYAILSKGLHELDEETCKRFFPIVRAAIIQILEQDFQKRAAEKAEADLARSIADITRQLKE